MNRKSICIHRKTILPSDLPKFSKSWSGDPDLPPFLTSWYDDHDTFTAFTSGSTGEPTQVHLKKTYASASARATIEFLQLRPGDTALLSMPAKYIAGRMMIVRAIEGELNLLPVSPSSCPQLPGQSIHLAAFTPQQFRNILRSVPQAGDLSIENVLLGGGPVQDELAGQFRGFRGRIFETFGMTETYSHIALRQRWPVEDPFFTAMPGVHFRTLDDKLIIHVPHLGIQDLQTNDIVRLEDRTRFQWMGRADFVINSGGIKFHPEIIEKKLTGMIRTPFFITGLPDDEFGEKIALVIQRDPDAQNEQSLTTILDKNLDRYEKPKSIIWVDNMIMTATGKINRSETKNFHQI